MIAQFILDSTPCSVSVDPPSCSGKGGGGGLTPRLLFLLQHGQPLSWTIFSDCLQKILVSANIAVTSCKIVETLSLKNAFSSFQYPPYLEFKPFPLPFPSPPFNVDCLSLQKRFCLASKTDKGGRGGEGLQRDTGHREKSR